MADETLGWELKLDDLMSGPLSNAEKALGGLDKALGKTAASADKLDEALGGRARDAQGRFLTTGKKIEQALGAAKSKLTGARADFAQAWQALLATPVGTRAITPLMKAFSSAGGKVGGLLRATGGGVAGALKPAFSRIGGVFAPLTTRLGSIWATLGGGLSRFGASAMTVLKPLGAGLAKVLGSVGSLAGAIAMKLGPALGTLGSYGAKGAAALVGIAGAVAAGAGALALAAGQWALGGLRFKEDTLVSFKTMLGTKSAAERVFKQATKFAATTPFSTEEVVTGFQRFLTAGFKEDQLDTLMKAVGDVGANMGTEKMDQVITALAQIKAKGKLQGEEMMQLAEAGVGQSAVFDALAKTLNISKSQAQARVTGGKVTGEQGIAAILEAIKTTQSGGTLGSAMEGKSKTLTGLLSSVADIPSTLLFASKMDAVMEPIKRALKGILDAFEEGQPLFLQAQKAFGRISAAWGKALSVVGGSNVNGLFSQIIGGIERFFVSLAPFAEGFIPELLNQVSMLFSALSGPDSSPEELRKNGESVARVLGTVAGTFLVLAKAAFVVLDALDRLVGKIANVLNWDWRSEAEQNRDREVMDQLNRDGFTLAKPNADGSYAPNAYARQVSTSVGNVYVMVQPGQENAGVVVANQIQGQLPQQLSGIATEMGG